MRLDRRRDAGKLDGVGLLFWGWKKADGRGCDLMGEFAWRWRVGGEEEVVMGCSGRDT